MVATHHFAAIAKIIFMPAIHGNHHHHHQQITTATTWLNAHKKWNITQL
jgi:hypothetical protein